MRSFSCFVAACLLNCKIYNLAAITTEGFLKLLNNVILIVATGHWNLVDNNLNKNKTNCY